MSHCNHNANTVAAATQILSKDLIPWMEKHGNSDEEFFINFTNGAVGKIPPSDSITVTIPENEGLTSNMETLHKKGYRLAILPQFHGAEWAEWSPGQQLYLIGILVYLNEEKRQKGLEFRQDYIKAQKIL